MQLLLRQVGIWIGWRVRCCGSSTLDSGSMGGSCCLTIRDKSLEREDTSRTRLGCELSRLGGTAWSTMDLCWSLINAAGPVITVLELC